MGRTLPVMLVKVAVAEVLVGAPTGKDVVDDDDEGVRHGACRPPLSPTRGDAPAVSVASRLCSTAGMMPSATSRLPSL